MDTTQDPTATLDAVRREAHTWIVRFASGRATSADLEAVKRWSARSRAHADAFAQASRLWDTLGPAGQLLRASMVYDEAMPRVAVEWRLGRRALIGGSLAAAAAGAAALMIRPPFGLWPSWTDLTADYRTAVGERQRIVLADRVSIELNTRTSLAVRSATSEGEQIELLAGEAVISAEQGPAGPLTVIAADGRVVASAATFNLRRDDRSVRVTCVTGEVSVERARVAKSLRAGQQLVYSARGLGMVVAVDPAIVTAWRDGIVIFHETPLSVAVEELNRYRRGRIILLSDALGRRLFSARFEIENVDRVVDQIRQVFGAAATVLPGGIVLLS